MKTYLLDLNTLEQMFCKEEGILAKFTDTSRLSIEEWLEEKEKEPLKYRIRDCDTYFADGEIFYSKKEIIDNLTAYHDIDYSGVKDNDEPYSSLYEFLDTLKDDETRLDWLLEHGQWEIEEVK